MKKIIIILLVILLTYGLIYRMEKSQSKDVYASRNKVLPSIFITPTPSPVDERLVKLQKFFKKYNSSLYDFSKKFIEVSDKYGFDWKLLPAISGVESTFGKFTPSCAKYNPFGWTSTTSPCGFYRFSSFSEAIEVVGRGIGTESFYDKFRKTKRIEDLAKVYCPVDDKWDKNLYYFISELEKI